MESFGPVRKGNQVDNKEACLSVRPTVPVFTQLEVVPPSVSLFSVTISYWYIKKKRNAVRGIAFGKPGCSSLIDSSSRPYNAILGLSNQRLYRVGARLGGLKTLQSGLLSLGLMPRVP